MEEVANRTLQVLVIQGDSSRAVLDLIGQRNLAGARPGVQKVYADAASALEGLQFDGMTIMSGGLPPGVSEDEVRARTEADDCLSPVTMSG